MESNADKLIAPTSPPSKSRQLARRLQQLPQQVDLANLRVGQKLGLIALAFAVPVAVPLTFLVVQQQQSINILSAERRGMDTLQKLGPLAPLVLQHGNASVRLASGNKASKEAAATLSAQMETLLVELRAAATAQPALGLEGPLSDFEELWALSSSGETAGDINDTIESYASLVSTNIAELYNLIGQNSGLILDSDLASNRMQDLLVTAVPSLQTELGALRMIVSAAQGKNKLAAYKERIEGSLSLLNTYNARTELTTGYVLKANPKLSETLGSASDFLSGKVTSYLSAVESAMQGGDFSRDTVSYLDGLAVEALSASDEMAAVTTNSLSGSLSARATQLNVSRFTTLLSIGAVIALALLLLGIIARSITQPLSRLASAAQSLGRGDLDIHVEAQGKDEIGVVANSFNEAAAQLRQAALKNVEERENALQLQQNINQFLDVTMSVAEGDLSRRGRVTDDVLGNVVDAINLALDEVSSVLIDVREVATQVNSSADEVASTSNVLTQAAQDQSSRTERMQLQTQEFTRVFRTMAEQVEETAQAAERTLEASQAGQIVVQDSRRGLEELRGEMQDISAGMTALAARSGEISEIAEAITNFASQTTLLALGASLEAAGAGEAGKRFSVVAEGVRQLAEDSANAAYRVESIVKLLQGDIASLASRVQSGAQGVDSGYQVAQRAGELLREIETLAEQSARVATGITDVTRQQVDEAEQVREAVSFIATTASQAEGESLRTLRSAERLSELARQLSAQLARFRLSS